MSGLVIWINGLSGSGKSTISKELYNIIKQEIPNIVYLDGDGFREIFSNNKFDKDSRIEVAFNRARLCSLLSQQDIVVIASTISLFNEVYKNNRNIFKNYLEVYIECNMEELIKRDQKGLYTGAIEGRVKDVIGIDIKYDIPTPNITIDNNVQNNADLKAKQILKYIKTQKIQWVK
ncbi:adenylyl-sulfate kinase [Helicobacter sp. MIT 99-5507]|uniref:adenylyl-sulfate kinase n=1 Tax=Helicobacter sp. MIT 99-5507 TaxID=152489 RepID=UPI000E1EF794|nr:adenylyl-sulfate kinase [Helicobacter sp. MIT 99-5507]RDU58263.1 adenylyl-sulfate kinase [Helicobacter sp. MIT 99-5507]